MLEARSHFNNIVLAGSLEDTHKYALLSIDEAFAGWNIIVKDKVNPALSSVNFDIKNLTSDGNEETQKRF